MNPAHEPDAVAEGLRPTEPPPPEASADQQSTFQTSTVEGSTSRGIVQARDISGGVHMHHMAPTERPGSTPRQLPTDVRGFVNRQDELDLLDEVAADGSAVRVLVIAGTAGVGKTALALRWAHRVRDRFPDGQFYADLRGYDPQMPVEPERVLERFLRALDVPASAVPTDLDALAAVFRSRVAGRRVLVVLDNAATAAQVRPLLPGTHDCLVVVTSRNRLSWPRRRGTTRRRSSSDRSRRTRSARR